MAALLKKTVRFIAEFAADHYPETLALLLVAVLSNFFASTYIIVGFNYLIPLLFTAGGIAAYHSVRRLIPSKKVQLLVFCAAFLAGLILCAVFFHQTIAFIHKYYIQNIVSLNELIRANAPTSFSSYLPFLWFLLPVTIALLFILYSVSAPAALALLYGVILVISSGGLDYYFKPYSTTILWLLISYTIIVAYMTQISSPRISVPRYIVVYSAGVALLIVICAQLFLSVFGSKSFTDRFAPVRHSIYANIAHLSGQKSTGFSDEDMPLGGDLFPDEGLALIVEAESPPYLRGKVRTTYDGRGWISEKPFSSFSTGKDNLSGTSIRSITVFPKKLKTSYLLTMRETIAIDSKEQIVSNTDRNYRRSDGKRSLRKYRVFYDEQGSSESYSSQLPPSLPKRVSELARSICKDEYALSDQMKIDAISAYLKTNYTYSLKSEIPPEGTDFVDYFLFVSKKGYCTSFASALTVMLRAVGVSANYIEGFHVTSTRDDMGRFEVTNKMAHAWCETRLGVADATPQGSVYTIYPGSIPPYLIGNLQALMPFGGNNASVQQNTPAQKSLRFSFEKFLPAKLAAFLVSFITNFLPILGIGLIAAWIFNMLYHEIFLFQPKSLLPLFRHVRRKLRKYDVKENPQKTAWEWLDEVYYYELKSPLRTIISALYREVYGGESVKIRRRALYRAITRELKLTHKRWFFWR